MGNKARLRFSGSRIKEEKITYDHGKIVKFYNVYEINENEHTTSSDPTLENILSETVSLTSISDIDKYKYSWYWMWFDRRRLYSGKL